MKRTRYLFIFLILIYLIGCNTIKDDSSDNKEEGITNTDSITNNITDDITGIRVSDWYKSEKYGKDIIDIMNFDDRDRTINVTTVCYGANDNIVPSNDSEILKIPLKNQWAWIPMCPSETVSYTIKITELD